LKLITRQLRAVLLMAIDVLFMLAAAN